jgi:hypothetical protein
MSIRVILQDNLWFRGRPELSNYRLNGRSMIPVTPRLGLTGSDDRGAKRQELEWAIDYTGPRGSGLVIAQEWIRPDNSIDENLRTVWLPIFEEVAPEGRWCIFYDPVLAAKQRGLLNPLRQLDFRRPKLQEMWQQDLSYLRQYFQHPLYWRLDDGHPVLYVWAAFAVRHSRWAFALARKHMLYVLADVLGTDKRPRRAQGLTGFTAALPGMERSNYRLPDLLPLYEAAYQALAEEKRFDFIPAGSCQYDDGEFMAARGMDETPLRILAADRSEVDAFLDLALSYARPIDGTRYLFWGTLNNWAEGTTVLPTRRRGPRFDPERLGHYRFAHLKALASAIERASE